MSLRFPSTVPLFPLLAALTLVWAPSGRAIPCQGGDDLAAGPCCSQIVPNLPLLPAMGMPALGVCWDQCQPASKADVRVVWNAPKKVLCSQYEAGLQVLDSATGLVLMTGTLHLDYTRTWYEAPDPTTQNLVQVWRFVAKADLTSTVQPGAAVPCPVPDCLTGVAAQPTAFFYGYLDYVQDCQNLQQWTASLVLFHGSDFFQHKPGISSRPGTFHPGRSFAVVAPHTSANPFVPAVLAEPGGALVGEAMRSMDANSLVACTVESRLGGGQRIPFASGCLETFTTTAPPQHTLSLLQGKGTCFDPTGAPGSFQSLAVAFPTLPWFHLVGTSLGGWTTAASYPGPERVWVNEGLFQTRFACSGEFFEVYYGATTADGFSATATDLVTPLPPFFLDLADNFTYSPLAGPFPLLGHVMSTEHLLYTNY